MNVYTGLKALLSPEECVLLLIDHQPFQFAATYSIESSALVNNVVGLAKAAKLFDVPTVLTTVTEQKGGRLHKDVQAVFPDQTPIDRTQINAWEDPRVVDAVAKTGRRKLAIAGLWTEICVAMPAIHALGDGYEVYIVTDASGGFSTEAHERAVGRMVQAGAVPITWMAFMCELQRDWAREATVEGMYRLFMENGGSVGANVQWEMQLLGMGR